MAQETRILISNRALIACSGADALHLLQRLVTADLAPLTIGNGALYTLLLTPQGRYRFDFFVVKEGDALYLDVPSAQAADLIATLEKYRLQAVAGFTIMLEATLMLERMTHGDILSFKDPRHEELGWRNWQQSADVSGGAFDYDALRIRLGIIEPSEDLSDNAMPLEYGLEKLGAISFNKGCYLGQELTARMHNRDLAKNEVIVMSDTAANSGTVLAKAGGLALVQVRREGK